MTPQETAKALHDAGWTFSRLADMVETGCVIGVLDCELDEIGEELAKLEEGA